jgi:hypothetical protein
VHHAPLDTPGDPIAALEKNIHHPVVLAEHERLERADAVLPREVGESFEQARPDSATLERVRDGERHLGPVARPVAWIEPGKGHNLAGTFPHERRTTGSVLSDEEAQSPCVERGKTKEPLVEALPREALEESHNSRRVAFTRAPQRQRRAVAKHDVIDRIGDLKCGEGTVGHVDSSTVSAWTISGG